MQKIDLDEFNISILAVYRLRRGLTQAELAKKAGCSRQCVSKIESQRVKPKLSTIDDLAAALDLTIKERNILRDRLR